MGHYRLNRIFALSYLKNYNVIIIGSNPQAYPQNISLQIYDGTAYGGVAQHRGGASADRVHDLVAREVLALLREEQP